MKVTNKYILKVNILLFIGSLFLIFFSCKPRPEVEVPSELKELEKIILKETNSTRTSFYPIGKNEIENCHIGIHIYIYIKNDTINASEESLSNYVKTISDRVNKVLKNKVCYKKLTISTSSENDKALKSYKHNFEFPIK